MSTLYKFFIVMALVSNSLLVAVPPQPKPAQPKQPINPIDNNRKLIYQIMIQGKGKR